ncbi:GNAT family N-acetyltransferase [Cohnella endophytica]|uniref:GNAT family N-acetyltransferase n=1 Tax=Cohnella endophytica TaxID=2419778 RepID=A0A494XVG7_9BACL|nr:GNAT family N-acetyltransferase [Cohnella endophytica]RKP51583.1 GNAT family N-acetyltransferase [Cohnella endophytica]
MLQKFEANDSVLNGDKFIADEVPYNLVLRISEFENSTRLKTPDDTLIFVQSGGNNAWLWVSPHFGEERKNDLMRELADHLKATGLPGVNSDPETAKRFAQAYSEASGVSYRTHMGLESYSCPELRKPVGVQGSFRKATKQDVATVAEFFAGFSEGAHGVTVDTASQIPKAEGAIDMGNLYLWIFDQRPVSMANIAHRSQRHARINAVYTPSAYRKNGYASAIVAELCSILESERLVPMLYADLTNPDANKVYRKIGFVENGRIADIKFK